MYVIGNEVRGRAMTEDAVLPFGLHRFHPDELGRKSRYSVPNRLLALYLSISFIWIVFSDRLVSAAFPDHATQSWVNTVKGIAFVVVTTIVMYVAVSVQTRRSDTAQRKLEDAWDETILGWALAMDARESHLAQHSQRVADMTVDLARRMGIPGEQLRTLYRGALLHDIGKLGVPEAVLSYPGKLNDEQWALIRQHPQNAVRMLSLIDFLDGALDIPHSHHERWDGSGYPQGLEGTDIPQWARIFAVTDVYDALTSYRSYHRTRSHDEAMAIIRAESGAQFDPEVVREFELMMQADRQQRASSECH